MDITTALDRLAALEAGLAITAPITASVKRVFTFPPNRQQALTDAPCWVNTWTLSRIEWTLGSLRRQEFYSVNAQLFVLDADLNRGAAIASAFLAPLLSAVQADPLLDGAVMDTDVRGGDPTLALLEWAGRGYPGLNVFVDLVIQN